VFEVERGGIIYEDLRDDYDDMLDRAGEVDFAAEDIRLNGNV